MLKTCKNRLKIAKERNDQPSVDFWEARIARKIARFKKYEHLKPKVKNGKKSKR